MCVCAHVHMISMYIHYVYIYIYIHTHVWSFGTPETGVDLSSPSGKVGSAVE